MYVNKNIYSNLFGGYYSITRRLAVFDVVGAIYNNKVNHIGASFRLF